MQIEAVRPAVEQVVLRLTPKEFHDLIVGVETAEPDYHNTERRTPGGNITYNFHALRATLLKFAKDNGL